MESKLDDILRDSNLMLKLKEESNNMSLNIHRTSIGINIVLQYLFMINFFALYYALPHGLHLSREPRGLEPAKPASSISARTDECLEVSDISNCSDDLLENQLPPKVVLCLNNCATCVKQWRSGVYKGRNCANDCMQQLEKPVESMDPDCSLLKYFNSSVLAGV